MKKRISAILAAVLTVLLTVSVLTVTASADSDWASLPWLTNTSGNADYDDCFKADNVNGVEVVGVVNAVYATEPSIKIVCSGNVADCSLGDGNYDVSGSDLCLHASAFIYDVTDVTVTYAGGSGSLVVYNKLGTPKESYDDNGEGTATDPYRIDTLARLNDLADAVAGGNKMEGKYFVLTADIGSSETPFTKIIGDDSHIFQGTFDGAGHSVTLNIASSAFNAGFIAVIGNKATVKNLITKGSVYSFHANAQVGGIAGQNIGRLINCASFASLNAYGNESYVGGIVAYTGNGAKTNNCYFAGTISAAGSKYNGVCERADGQMGNCFYDNTKVTDGLTIGGSTGLSTDQMKGVSGTLLSTAVADNKPLIDLLNGYNDASIAGYKWIVSSDYPTLVPCLVITNEAPESSKTEKYGFVSLDMLNVLAGETVTVTVTPNDGYVLKSLSVTDADGNAVTVVDDTFVMPEKNVTVSAEFEYHTHVGEKQNGRIASEENAGYLPYYQCAICEGFFSDEDCTAPIEDIEAWKTTGAGALPQLSHEYGEDHRCKNCKDYEPQYAIDKDAAIALLTGVYTSDDGTLDFATTDEQVRKNGEALYGTYEMGFYRFGDTIVVISRGSHHAKYMTAEIENNKAVSITTYASMTEAPNGTFFAEGMGKNGNGNGKDGLSAGAVIAIVLGAILLLVLAAYVALFFVWKKERKFPAPLAFLAFLEPSYRLIDGKLFGKEEKKE